MIDFGAIRTAIVDRVEAGFSSTPISWPGQTYTPEDSVNFFTRIDVMFVDADKVTLTTERATGFLAVGFYARMNQGTDEITGFMDTFRALFPDDLKLLAFGARNIRFFTSKPRNVIYEADGIWCQQPLICNWWLDT